MDQRARRELETASGGWCMTMTMTGTEDKACRPPEWLSWGQHPLWMQMDGVAGST